MTEQQGRWAILVLILIYVNTLALFILAVLPS